MLYMRCLYIVWLGLFRAPYWVATASDVPAAVMGLALDCWRVYKTGIKPSQCILLMYTTPC